MAFGMKDAGLTRTILLVILGFILWPWPSTSCSFPLWTAGGGVVDQKVIGDEEPFA
jgi:hypothetical protein